MGYQVEDLCSAILGCAKKPHNLGQNDRGQRYDGLHIILRDADQIDRFRHNDRHPPKMLNEAETRIQKNQQAAVAFLNQPGE